mgnify:CR=1 FL=1
MKFGKRKLVDNTMLRAFVSYCINHNVIQNSFFWNYAYASNDACNIGSAYSSNDNVFEWAAHKKKTCRDYGHFLWAC